MKIGFDKSQKRGVVGIVVVACILLSLMPIRRVSAQPLRVCTFRNVSNALIWIADSRGFFKKQGLEVTVKEYETGPQMVSDLMADKADIGTVTEVAFVLQSFKNRDLRIPATICMMDYHDLVVRKDRGILQPKDLKGKRVAVVRGTSGEFFLYNYLLFNNIPAADVRIVYLDPSEIVRAMADRTIDATLLWPPYPAEMAKQLGEKVARWPAQSGQDTYMALVAKEGFLKKQQKAMEKFLAALLEAEGFIEKDPDRAKAVLRDRFKADADLFREGWSRTRPGLRLTQDLLVLMEREARWAMRTNLVEKREMPNYLGSFYFEALDKVKPEAVSIVH